MSNPLCSKNGFNCSMIGFTVVRINSSIFVNIFSDDASTNIGLVNSFNGYTCIIPFSSNSQTIFKSVNTDTLFPFPINRINFIIKLFCKNGIFLPSTLKLGAYKRYILSCLVSGLNLINGK